jgi:mannitol-1-/sugar-/sorbitol-6-phosphatase
LDLTGVRAVLLDMDGTLVDSDAVVERVWREWAREHDVDLDGGMTLVHGSPPERTIRRLRPDLPDAAVAAEAARLRALEYEDISGVSATPGAAELLSVLGRLGLAWAVVTSADTRLAGIRLGAAGLAAPLLITVDDVRAGKPDPESYLLAAERLGVPPGRCLVVEDAEPGVAAGRAAGAMVAGLKRVPADLQIDDLHQLAGLLNRARTIS